MVEKTSNIQFKTHCELTFNSNVCLCLFYEPHDILTKRKQALFGWCAHPPCSALRVS